MICHFEGLFYNNYVFLTLAIKYNEVLKTINSNITLYTALAAKC